LATTSIPTPNENNYKSNHARNTNAITLTSTQAAAVAAPDWIISAHSLLGRASSPRPFSAKGITDCLDYFTVPKNHVQHEFKFIKPDFSQTQYAF
jgi:hypothetical protein